MTKSVLQAVFQLVIVTFIKFARHSIIHHVFPRSTQSASQVSICLSLGYFQIALSLFFKARLSVYLLNRCENDLMQMKVTFAIGFLFENESFWNSEMNN